MPLRGWLQITIQISALLLTHSAAFAQQEPVTADQVISRYMDAIGANRFSTITTFIESGDLDGNLTNFWRGAGSTSQSERRQHGTFESYFKTPNFRFESSVTEKNQLISLHGCDGKVAWSIDPSLGRHEFKPKPDSDDECEKGGMRPPRFTELKAKKRPLIKKNIEGRMTWGVEIDDPKSRSSGKYYFDAQTFLLLRFESMGMSTTYSDYRDAGAIKIPFLMTQEYGSSKLLTRVREVKIDTPIDDARFVEPQIKGRKVVWDTESPKNDSPEPVNVAPSTEYPTKASQVSPPEQPPANGVPSVVEVSFPNYTACSLDELKSTVPELKDLKPQSDQGQLSALLEKVGAKTLAVARDTPNLISRESVTEWSSDSKQTRRDYDYLIVARLDSNVVVLDEFRLDLKSGDKFQTDEVIKNDSSLWDNLKRASNEVAASSGGRPPISQGFATSWLHFYPPNRKRTSYRYLGEQKMDGHRTLVLAFAQNPAAVLFPALYRYHDKTAPMYLQGIAWIDPSDFRILRLRTDLLSPIPEVSLHRLTADIHFGLTRIEQVPSPLQLPREVRITATVGESTIREVHVYSGYRVFRVKSRVVPAP